MALSIEEKIERLIACRNIRKIAAQTCLYTFQQILNKNKKISEINFKNRWNKELEKAWNLGYVDCWYDPPPYGIAAIFSDDNNFERLNYSNLRKSIYWPKINYYFKKNGSGYVFASPYTLINDIPIIGDFGFTYYNGNTELIRDHFKRSYSVLRELIDNIKTGRTFKEVFTESINLINKNNLINNILGITDKAGTDLGHSIPFVDRNPTTEETDKLYSGDPEKINSAISKARVYISSNEDFEITDNCAFTFEPRLTDINMTLPIFSFHTIIQFVEGKKVVVNYFDGLINLLGMNWIR
jgi:hypothetical protein